MTPPTFLGAVREYLDAIEPGLFNVLVGLSAVLVVWAMKKWRPDWFAKLPPAAQALPATFWSAVVGALSSSSATLQNVVATTVTTALIGGVTGIGAHRALKESPLPYGNPKPDPLVSPSKRPPPPAPPSSSLPATLGMIFVVLLVAFGCSKPWHAADPTVDSDITSACHLLGSQRTQEIEAIATTKGISLDDAVKIFEGLCSLRMNRAAQEASEEGLDGLRRK